MKKLFMAAVVAFVGMVGLNAQSMESIQVGVRAGYNYSTLRGDAAEGLDVKGRSGYNVGLFVEVPVSKRLSIQPEVSYSTQGASNILFDGDEIKTQNINVPILAKLYIVDGLNIQAGPQVSFNTGTKYRVNSGLLSGLEFDDDDMTKGFNFGAVVGAGYKLPMGLSIDARYNFGFTNVLDKNSGSFRDSFRNISGDNDFKDGVFSIGLGYQF